MGLKDGACIPSFTVTFSFLLSRLYSLSLFSFLLHLCLCYKLAGGTSVIHSTTPVQILLLMSLKAGRLLTPGPQ